MIYSIPIPNNPNETFSSTIAGNIFRFTLRTFHDVVYATIEVNEQTVITGAKVCPNCLLLPKSAESVGNFVFYSPADDEYPDSDNFNESCTLLYIDKDSIDEMRSSSSLYDSITDSLQNYIQGG